MRKFIDKHWAGAIEYVMLDGNKLYIKTTLDDDLTRVGESLTREEIYHHIEKHLRSGRFVELENIRPTKRINKFELA
jgi:hypothetical protein